MNSRSQLALFEDPAQPRSPEPEHLPTYNAVMKLRRSGYYVRRAGRESHFVRKRMDTTSWGRTLNTRQLIALAASLA